MRICHILATGGYSGAENIVIRIAENSDHEHVYCSPTGIINEYLEKSEIRHYAMRRISKKTIRRMIDDIKPDIIHAHDFRASIFAGLANTAVPIVSHLHNNPGFINRWNVKTLLYKYVAKRFSKIIAVSDAIVKESIFLKTGKYDITVVPNYIDVKHILSAADKHRNRRTEKPCDVVFIGRITEQKQPITFISIINEIKKKIPAIKAVMIGSGDMMTTCANFIKKCGLEKNIEMIGFQKNPYGIIAGSKVVLMPSRHEGFGLTAIEAMVLGVPVLASDVGGLRTIFADHPCFLCKNIDAFAQKAVELLTAEGKNEEIKKIHIKYTDANVWKKNWRNIYLELSPGKKMPKMSM